MQTMKRTRREIMPGVWLTCISTEKFKTNCLSVTLLAPLERGSASMNALIPRVLLRGSSAYPDMRAISEHLEELYGSHISGTVRKKGEIQCVGLYASFVDDRYLPEEGSLLEKITAMLGNLLLSPNTRGGLLRPDYVESEKEKLLDDIRARINEKRSYSINRLIEEMCSCEAYAVDKLGSENEAENIGYQKLTKQYRQLLATSPVEIFYCGSADFYRVLSAVNEAFGIMPRGELNCDIGTDIRMNAVEEAPRYFTEELDVTQGKLAIGFRLGECMLEMDEAAILVMNAIYGGSVTSKLFMNVREKLSLCYFASSVTERHKGIMLVSSGVEFRNYQTALDEILAQLEAVRQGDISDYELSSAKNYIASSMRSTLDSASALEEYWLSRIVDGSDYAPDELAALCSEVTKEQVIKIAQSIETDAIYFLRGKEETAASGEEAAE